MSQLIDDPAPRRSFIEEARRTQLVTCAIDTIAELGFGQASLARIAERAEISKGVIGYHFAGKDELLSVVVAEVLARGREYIEPRVTREPSGRGKLRAYVEASAAFMGEYRNHVIALVDITRNWRPVEGSAPLGPAFVDTAVTGLAQLLAKFQETGEFRRDFDPVVAATAIRAAIDAVPRRLASDSEVDVEHYGRELAELFDLAVRREAHGQDHDPEPRPE
jgi:TetR/AcrR family transcriptional regulator, fatty acid metabolism regulator protein